MILYYFLNCITQDGNQKLIISLPSNVTSIPIHGTARKSALMASMDARLWYVFRLHNNAGRIFLHIEDLKYGVADMIVW